MVCPDEVEQDTNNGREFSISVHSRLIGQGKVKTQHSVQHFFIFFYATHATDKLSPFTHVLGQLSQFHLDSASFSLWFQQFFHKFL